MWLYGNLENTSIKGNAVEIKVALASCRFDGAMPNCHMGDIGLGASIIPAFQAAVWKQHGIGVQCGGKPDPA